MLPTSLATSTAGLAARALATSVLCVIVGLTAVSALPALLGWRTTVVMSGSMEPGIRTGDVVATQPVDPGVVIPGQVVLVRDPGQPDHLLMHRLVSIDADGKLVTKGDANRDQDSTPVEPADLLGLPRLRVPFIGLPIVWLQQGRTALAGVSLIGMLGTALLAVGPGAEPGRHRRDEIQGKRRRA